MKNKIKIEFFKIGINISWDKASSFEITFFDKCESCYTLVECHGITKTGRNCGCSLFELVVSDNEFGENNKRFYFNLMPFSFFFDHSGVQ